MFIQKEMTAEEFLLFAEQHPDKRFDFMDGEMVEVSPRRVHSRMQVVFASELEAYTQKNPVGVVYTEALHELKGQKFIPDVCVNIDSDTDYFTTPPLLAVEIRSDSQSAESQRRKARDYIKHGTKMVVLVLPGRAFEVYRPGRKPLVLKDNDVFDGDDVLPGFKLPVKKLLKLR